MRKKLEDLDLDEIVAITGGCHEPCGGFTPPTGWFNKAGMLAWYNYLHGGARSAPSAVGQLQGALSLVSLIGNLRGGRRR